MIERNKQVIEEYTYLQEYIVSVQMTLKEYIKSFMGNNNDKHKK